MGACKGCRSGAWLCRRSLVEVMEEVGCHGNGSGEDEQEDGENEEGR